MLRLDHLVLTVRDLARSVGFYSKVFGFVYVCRDGRSWLEPPTPDACPSFRIHLHEFGRERHPHAGTPLPGSADLCFVDDLSVMERRAALEAAGVMLELGPVEREGAGGRLESLYFRDPDGNLIEWARVL